MFLFKKQKVSGAERKAIEAVLEVLQVSEFVGSDPLFTKKQILEKVEKEVGNGSMYAESNVLRSSPSASPRDYQGHTWVYFLSGNTWFEVMRVKSDRYLWTVSTTTVSSNYQRAQDDWNSDVY